MNQSLTKRLFFWYGLYYGIASILMFTVIYAVNFEYFGRIFMLMLLSMLLLVTFLTMGGIAERKANGGYLKYVEAIKYLFFIGVIGYIVNLIFTIVFSNFIDPDFNKNLGEVIKESTMKWMQDMNVPDEKIDAQMLAIDKQMANYNSPLSYLKQLFGGVAMATLFAFICAMFVKRNPPEKIVDFKTLDTEN